MSDLVRTNFREVEIHFRAVGAHVGSRNSLLEDMGIYFRKVITNLEGVGTYMGELELIWRE